MKRFTLKVLNKMGLTLSSESIKIKEECSKIEAYRNNTIAQLKANNKSIKTEHSEKISRLKETLNSYRVDIQRLTKKNITPKLDQSKLQRWSKEVRKVGKCDICSTTETENLTAHHLYDKANHPTLAYKVENGVCLCHTHHKQFHDTCKEVECTPQGYYNFKKNFYKGKQTFLSMRDEDKDSRLSA